MGSCYRGLGVDTFVFCPAAEGKEESRLRLFPERGVPKVRAFLAEKAVKAKVA